MKLVLQLIWLPTFVTLQNGSLGCKTDKDCLPYYKCDVDHFRTHKSNVSSSGTRKSIFTNSPILHNNTNNTEGKCTCVYNIFSTSFGKCFQLPRHYVTTLPKTGINNKLCTSDLDCPFNSTCNMSPAGKCICRYVIKSSFNKFCNRLFRNYSLTSNKYKTISLKREYVPYSASQRNRKIWAGASVFSVIVGIVITAIRCARRCGQETQTKTELEFYCVEE